MSFKPPRLRRISEELLQNADDSTRSLVGILNPFISDTTDAFQSIAGELSGGTGDTSWVTVTGSQLRNSWRRYSNNTNPPGYRKEGKRVHLRGLVSGGTPGLTSDVFVLPDGFRPAYDERLVAITNNAGTSTLGDVAIAITGVVTLISGGSTFFSLDGLSFDAA